MNQVQQFFEYIFNAVKILVIVQPWQQGIRVRCGKKITRLDNGIYFRIPYFDSIYIQESRLRVVSMSIQTLTSKDLKNVTISGSIGYTIQDIEKLYQSLFHPETTISNMAMSAVSKYVFETLSGEIDFYEIENEVLDLMNDQDFGIKFSYFKMNNFAIVRTYRLIQDHSWISDDLNMNDKK